MNVSSSMSQKIGLILFQGSEWTVAANVNGVVITSPDNLKTLHANCNAVVPFEKLKGNPY